ncbi:MAG: dehydrogenase [Planctomycetes bacterium]|nr:dehydrogenase [Planctomycetota bacterium]
MRTHRCRALGLSALCSLPLAAQTAPARLELRRGDHVAILGSALADRWQHTGWFEAHLQATFPSHELVVRTLAVAGDEVTTWHRSDGFGSRDEWLANVGATVVIACYGSNESHAGAAGLPAFRAALRAFVDDLRSRSLRVALCTPIAAERHRDPAFPDPTQRNTELAAYAAAVQEVAAAAAVPCVDLFTASLALYALAAAADRSLTVNGLHLDDEGDRQLAPVLCRGLFGDEPAPVASLLLAEVRAKSRCWHQRYRTIDGYNVFGGRSYEKYAPKDHSGVTGEPILNRTVLLREMAIRDAMTRHHDARVHAVAAGREPPAAAPDLPPPLPVATNHPGDRADLSWSYPDPEAVVADLQVAPGCRVNLFASERQFPELVNPVQMAWDTRHRLWVATWPNYPSRTPHAARGDALLVLTDDDGDGRADTCTTFASDLNAPTGFTFCRDGVLLVQAPDLWFLRDTDGDGRADRMQRVLMGIDSADSHHTTNAMGLDPALATTLSDGYFHRTQIETWRGPLRHADGCIWRFEPRTGRVELYAPYEFVNAHGKVWDEWGNDLLTNATGNHTFFGPAISGRLDRGKHPDFPQFWDRPSRPCPGTGMVASAHFPDDWQGDFLNLNVIGLQAVTRVDVQQDGAGLRGTTVEHVVAADPKVLPTFRPVAVGNGPDGALYIADWAQALIGHLQHHIRDPNRDHAHGRIYRITHEGRPLARPPRIADQPIAALLPLLAHPVQDVRTLAKLELSRHAPADVTAALPAWLAQLDVDDPRHEHHLLEALWTCQALAVVDRDLLERVLTSPEPRARAAATKVLCDWREQVPDWLDRVRPLATDDDPRVRLHALRAASFADGADAMRAAQVAFAALALPFDHHLDYVFGETLRQLRTLVPADTVLQPDDPALAVRFAPRLTDDELRRAAPTAAVLGERLDRGSVDALRRGAALERLVALHAGTAAIELVASLQRQDARDDTDATLDTARLLVAQPTDTLRAVEPALDELARGARRPPVRHAALAALCALAGDGAPRFAAAADDAGRADVLAAIAMLPRADLRGTLAATVHAVLDAGTAAPAVRAAALQALPLLPAAEPDRAFAWLSAALRDDALRGAAARALLQLPRDRWQPDLAAAGAAAVLAWAETVPPAQRTAADFLAATQCADELAGLAASDEAAMLRRGLRALGVRRFVLHTVREQMRYDRARLVVEAGQAFELLLHNDDFMAHNLAVVKPGARFAVGQASATMSPLALDAEGRAYVPPSDDLVAATALVEPGQRAALAVPALPAGDYEYVCTVPGHFTLMWGTLVVTDDVEAWHRAHADAPTAPAAPPVPHDHGHGHR